MEELERFHRKQLRHVLRMRFPRSITNIKLYETTKTVELKHILRQARWRLFGHVLRMSNETPAKLATTQYFNTITGGEVKRFRGRPRKTLPVLLDEDLKLAHQHYTTSSLNCLPKQLKTSVLSHKTFF